MPFIEPLALQTLLVNTFSGSWLIFTFVSLIFIAALAARFRMNNAVFGIVFVLFAILMAAWIPSLYVLAIIITAAVISFIIAKIVKN